MSRNLNSANSATSSKGNAMRTSVKQRTANRVVNALAAARHRVASKLPSATEVAPQVWIHQGVDGAHNVEFEGANVVGRGTSFQGRDMSLGRGATVGIGCIFNGPLSIGRYAQLGSYVGVYGVDHPTDVAVPNVNRYFIGGVVKTLGKADPVRIGHGCWIGHGAVVLRGVSIGNGAVVGAGSIVTADVPAYSVVVGVPAGEPKPRFDPQLAAMLEESRWWSWSSEEFESSRELFLTSFLHDPDRAARLLAEISARNDPPGRGDLGD